MSITVEPVAGTWAHIMQTAEGTQSDRRWMLLTQICLAYSDLSRDYLFDPRPGGLPSGRPSLELTREAGRLLIGGFSRTTAADDVQITRRVIGLLHCRIDPRLDDPRAEPEDVDASLAVTREAVSVADSLGDFDLQAWSLLVLGKLLWRAARHEEAFGVLTACVDAVDQAVGQDARCSVHTAAGDVDEWLGSHSEWRTVLGILAVEHLGNAASALGRYDEWSAALLRRRQFAESVAQHRPRLYARGLRAVSDQARVRGDRQQLIELEQQLVDYHDQLVMPTARDDVARVIFSTRSANAEALKDWGLALMINQERLKFVCDSVIRRASAKDGLESSTGAVLEWLAERGDRTVRAAIGNAALNQSLALQRSGEASQNEKSWQHASDLLDLAAEAYQGYGSNGFVAVRNSRTRLLHNAPGGPRQSLDLTVGEFLAVSRQGKIGTLRRNAVMEAARLCVPGDPRVGDRLAEMLTVDLSVHRSRLLAGRVIWLARSLSPDASQLEIWALEAAGELESGGQLQDPVLAVECWAAAARAGAELGRPSEVVLQRWLQAVRCLAVQLVRVTSTAERVRLGRSHSAILISAADAAVAAGDGQAAEFVMEAVRRDRVGSLLAELARDPRVSEQVRVAAERVLLANAAQGEKPQGLPPDSSARGSWLMRAGSAVDENRQAATEQAREVIGPLAALSDLSSIGRVTAIDLLQHADPSRPAAVLQLLTNTGGFLPPATAAGYQVYWVVTTREPAGTVRRICGVTPLPVDPATLTASSGTFWIEIAQLSGVLLPDPLREFLCRHGPIDPVQLTVVPTGLLTVPFDALVVDEAVGWQVIDCAEVTIVGAVATAVGIATAPARPLRRQDWLAVYDTDGLPGAERELAAMNARHTPVHAISTKEALDAQLTNKTPAGLFAMAVHGSDDEAGWGQTKRLPDGSTIRAVDVLRWTAPDVCVLASCHSTLTAADGVELGGFPIALLLRGARTVIGSLQEINDETTAEIMSRFWRHTTRRERPAEALRHAKLDFLRSDPDRRLRADLWAALIAYGHR